MYGLHEPVSTNSEALKLTFTFYSKDTRETVVTFYICILKIN